MAMAGGSASCHPPPSPLVPAPHLGAKFALFGAEAGLPSVVCREERSGKGAFPYPPCPRTSAFPLHSG